MKKNTIIVVLGIAVVVLAAIHFWPKPNDICGACGKEKQSCADGCNHDPCICINPPPPPPGTNDIVRPPLPSDALNRLWDGKKRITTIAEVSGHGAYGKYGVEGTGDFYYSATIDAVSEIVSKSKTDYGEICIDWL